MKIKLLIKDLQEVLKEHGNIEVKKLVSDSKLKVVKQGNQRSAIYIDTRFNDETITSFKKFDCIIGDGPKKYLQL